MARSYARKYWFAGISVTNQDDGSKLLKFHVSKLENVLAVWLKVPGSAYYEYVRLPALSSKYEAACFLQRHKNFQSPAFVRNFIADVVAKYDPANAKKPKTKDEQVINKRHTRKGPSNV